MLTPDQLLPLLRSAHYHYITEAQMRCLKLFAIGYGAEQIGLMVAESASTVRRHLADVRRPVTTALGIELSPGHFRTWVWCHVNDCTAPVLELIDDAQNLHGFGHTDGK